MDEEVILESSPFYQHLKEIESDFSINGLEFTPPTINSDEPLPSSDGNLASARGCRDNLSNIAQVERSLRRLICKDLMNSSCLIEEHHNVLQAYIESYLDLQINKETSEIEIIGNFNWRLLIHGALTGICLAAGSGKWKCAAAISLIAHLSVPAIQNMTNYIMAADLRLVHSILLQRLELFSQYNSVWRSVRQFTQELSLISLSSTLRRKHQDSQELCSETETLQIRQCAHLYLKQNIENMEEDIKYLHQLIDGQLVDQLGFTLHFCPFISRVDMSSLQKNHKTLTLLVSQWIFLIVLLVLGPKTTSKQLLTHIEKLTGLSTPDQLGRALKFRRMTLDGELHPHTNNRLASNKTANSQQALHSLYLHARELLRLAKLGDTGLISYDEGLFTLINEQLLECNSCLELANRRHHSTAKRCFSEAAAKICERDILNNQPAYVDVEPIIDQMFETGEQDGGDFPDIGFGIDSKFSDELQLRKQYERHLMRELKGVVNQLAEERVSREDRLSHTEGKTAEQIARITQQLIENRDIRALVKSAGEHEEVPAEVDCKPKAVGKYAPVEDDYEQPPEQLHHLKNIAMMAALSMPPRARCEEIFGDDDSNDSSDDDCGDDKITCNET